MSPDSPLNSGSKSGRAQFCRSFSSWGELKKESAPFLVYFIPARVVNRTDHLLVFGW